MQHPVDSHSEQTNGQDLNDDEAKGPEGMVDGTGEYVDIAPNLWLSARTYGAVDSLDTWTFRSKGGQTRVTMTINYRIPPPLSGRLTESTINSADREAEVILTNLRTRYDNRVYHS